MWMLCHKCHLAVKQVNIIKTALTLIVTHNNRNMRIFCNLSPTWLHNRRVCNNLRKQVKAVETICFPYANTSNRNKQTKNNQPVVTMFVSCSQVITNQLSTNRGFPLSAVDFYCSTFTNTINTSHRVVLWL